jgi:hypothetical protein
MNLMLRNPGRVFYLRGPREEAVPFNAHHLLNNPEYPPREQEVRALFSRLLIGAYIFAENLSEVPLRLVPAGNDELLSRIFCQPVTGLEPLRALCKIDGLCSYQEGPVRTLRAQNASYALITMASTLNKSSVSYFSVYRERPLSTEFLNSPSP